MTRYPIVIPATPSPILSPNARGHWAPKARAASRFRETARLATLGAISDDVRAALADRQSIGYTLAISWERKRRGMLDEDNALASCKAAIDGVAEAIGIDDRRLRVKGIALDTTSRLGVTTITLITEE